MENLTIRDVAAFIGICAAFASVVAVWMELRVRVRTLTEKTDRLEKREEALWDVLRKLEISVAEISQKLTDLIEWNKKNGRQRT